MTVPGDNPSGSGSGISFGTPFDLTATWTGSTFPFVFSATNSAKLVLPIDPAQAGAVTFFLGATYETIDTQFLDYLMATLSIQCSGVSCGSATSANRTVDVCLSVDNATCATPVKKYISTTGAVDEPFGDTTGFGMTSWLPYVTPIDHVLASQQNMNVTISGSTMTFVSSVNVNNELFRPEWGNGTRVALAGAGCHCICRNILNYR